MLCFILHTFETSISSKSESDFNLFRKFQDALLDCDSIIVADLKRSKAVELDDEVEREEVEAETELSEEIVEAILGENDVDAGAVDVAGFTNSRGSGGKIDEDD